MPESLENILLTMVILKWKKKNNNKLKNKYQSTTYILVTSIFSTLLKAFHPDKPYWIDGSDRANVSLDFGEVPMRNS